MIKVKIKLAILEKDIGYLNRIVSAFSTKYAENLEIYSFTDMDVALSNLETARIDVLLANDIFNVDVKLLPKRCGFAYFVESSDIESVREQSAICKFQKADLIYKQILSIYSENSENVSGLRMDDGSTRIVTFQPISGGCGASTVAASYAVHLAKAGIKVLYLNLEKFGSSNSFFPTAGQFDMSDIIFALKSKKVNFAIKLESCVNQDESGVFYYSQSKIALDMLELTSDDIIRLISEIKLTSSYGYIIIDMDFSIEPNMLKVLRESHNIIWVGDGSEISNTKFFRAYNALSTIEQKSDASLISRLNIIYNKFSNKTGKILNEINIKNLGGIPKYEHATTKQIMGQISVMDMFDKID